MKRLTSILLCLALILNIFSFSVMAEENYNFSDEQQALLTALGMLNENLVLSDKVTRAEFADLLVRSVFDNPEYLIEGTETFNDVAVTHDCYSSIMLLKNLGVTLGDGNGNFKPEEKILANDAVVMAVRFLGYSKIAEKYGILAFASSKGITKGVVYTADEELSLYNAFLIVFNVLNVDVTDQYANKDTAATFLAGYRNIFPVKGVVTDDGIINRYGLSELSNNKIAINGTVYKNTTNEKNLFGCSIKGYIRTNMYDEAELIAVVKTNDNKTVVIDARNIENFDSDNMTYEYRENNAEETTEYIEIPKGSSIVYNGVPLSVDDFTFEKEDFVPQSGSVVFFDSDDDNLYDYLYVNSYETYIVSAVDAAKEVIYFKENEKALQLKPDKYEVINSKGESIDIATLTDGDTLSVMKSINGDLIKIYVSSSAITDCIVSKDMDGTVVTQGSGTYKLSSHYINKAYVNSSDKNKRAPLEEALKTIEFLCIYRIHLDVFGDIAYIAPAKTNLWFTGYIAKIGNNSRSTLNENYVIELFSMDGMVSTYPLAKNVTISDENNISNKYKEAIASDKILNFAGNQTNSNRLVRYKLNTEGEIYELEFPLADNYPIEEINTDRLYIVHDARDTEVMYSTTYDSFTGKIVPEADCNVVFIDENNTENSERYVLGTVSNSFIHNSKDNMIAYGTDTKSLKASQLVVLRNESSVRFPSAATNFFAVSDIIQFYDKEEECAKYRLEGYNGITKATFYVEDVELITKAPIFETGETVELGVGDIILFSTDETKAENKTINGLRVLYDADGILKGTGKGMFGKSKGTIAGATDDKILDTSTTVYGNPVACARVNSSTATLTVNTTGNSKNPSVNPCRVAVGFVYSVSDGDAVLTTQPLNTQKYQRKLDATGLYVTEPHTYISSKVITIKQLSSDKAKVEIGGLEDLKPYTVYGHDCSMVVFLGYSGVNFVYVIE